MSGALTARVVVKAVHYGQESWRVELGDWYDENVDHQQGGKYSMGVMYPRSRVLTQHCPV